MLAMDRGALGNPPPPPAPRRSLARSSLTTYSSIQIGQHGFSCTCFSSAATPTGSVLFSSVPAGPCRLGRGQEPVAIHDLQDSPDPYDVDRQEEGDGDVKMA
ncbi:unnamed protein product [Prorocentrum cordatum]|uniref:Uncharacterized protein n=1 Tax=Prorocentrum cordatum TaxID=2364126 RepID=A0ABN9PQK4_9DINO|nr:unnamed protein product [Polarella glacialis]